MCHIKLFFDLDTGVRRGMKGVLPPPLNREVSHGFYVCISRGRYVSYKITVNRGVRGGVKGVLPPLLSHRIYVCISLEADMFHIKLLLYLDSGAHWRGERGVTSSPK